MEPLIARVPGGPPPDPEQVLDLFLGWAADRGFAPYPAQEQAFLEVMAGHHVILGTPTGSGKSLVATLVHFKALCERKRSFYTAPTKALTSEKFFWLCDEFGAENVGMLTGDASINAAAPIVCCTTEVLANMALRQGAATPVPYVVLDEFHFYADRARGVAWQVPLITLPHTTFLLMSATLGDPASIARRLAEFTGREVAQVLSEERPVPLDFTWRETPLHETVEWLLEQGRAPIYVVHFTQRECAEQAQGLTSARICNREERARIAEAIGDFRFTSPYGRELRRFLGFGIGVHHAGLLPKYRLLVEQLSQRGLLKVICGTDTLGVGVNIPIRTVLFSGLAKFDGEKVTLLSEREFKQIAGRAGRKGFDEHGSVVCQAPARVIERRRGARRDARGRPKGRGKEKDRGRARAGGPGRRAGPRDAPVWTRDTFERLTWRPPPPLESRFKITHGMMVQLLQRDPAGDAASGYRAVAALIERCHERPARKARLRREAARVFRSLRRAGIVEVLRDPSAPGRHRVRVSEDLQVDFSLNHTLSLYLVDAVHALDARAEDYALEVLALVEAILENPRAILYAQRDTLRQELMAQLKAERVPFEERVRQVEAVSWPQPEADFIYETFRIFAEKHPWVREAAIQPKAIARELFETYARFDDFVRRYRLARSEGVLLRYLGDVYRTLVQNVPAFAKTPQLHEILAFLRMTVTAVDQSLLEEWESLLHPAARAAPERVEAPLRFDLAQDANARNARIRAELHRLVKLCSELRFEDAVAGLRPDASWDAAALRRAFEPFFAEHGRLRFDHAARLSEHTVISDAGPRRWRASQVLLDPDDQNDWCIEVEADLGEDANPTGPLLRLLRVGP